MSATTAEKIIECIRKKSNALLCLAAGDTPRQAYQLVASRVRTEKIDISKCKFVSLDEWVGIPPSNEGSCQFFLRTNLFDPMKIAEDQIHLFNAMSPDLDGECKKMDQFISDNNGIDMMVVGIGRNGHIGFNEPGVDPNLYSHVVPLDHTTQTVGQKYFKENTALTQGITLGLQYLIESRNALLIANGSNKAEVIKKTLEETVDPQMPASYIRKHGNAVVILDEQAAALLEKSEN